MAQTALPAPHHTPARRRVFFGLFAADGWPWAFVKALFWFVVIIVMLGYIPDRAYYFTVQKTVDIGLIAWSPVNLCPPSNETVPCPAPAGAALPWQPAPGQVNLPAPRTDGVAGVIGETYIYAGGSDGTAPTTDVWYTRVVGTGNIDVWTPGPSLPQARSHAASVVVGSTLYVIGGYDLNGQPTDTVFSLTLGTNGEFEDWQSQDEGLLPEPRAGASAVAVSDGIVVLGGTDGEGPTQTVYRTVLDDVNVASWTEDQPMLEANMDGVAVHVGDIVFVIGGTNADGAPVATVQQGLVGGPNATPEDPNYIGSWRASAQTNLPVARTDMSGFTANGVIYVQGGSDGTAPQKQTYWAVPDAEGVIPVWQNLAATDLGEGLSGSSAVQHGSFAFLFGGTTAGGPTAGVARTNLAPQEPFFQLGVLGAVIPALQLQGEVGQQIGYLNAAGVGTVNFIILILIGYLYAHPEKVRGFVARRRARKQG